MTTQKFNPARIAELANNVASIFAYVEDNNVVCTFRGKKNSDIVISEDGIENGAGYQAANAVAELKKIVEIVAAEAVVEVAEVVAEVVAENVETVAAEVVEVVTLESTLPGVDFEGMERYANVPCEIVSRKMAPNGCGAEFILVKINNKLTCVVVEDNLAEIDNSYIKSIFKI